MSSISWNDQDWYRYYQRKIRESRRLIKVAKKPRTIKRHKIKLEKLIKARDNVAKKMEKSVKTKVKSEKVNNEKVNNEKVNTMDKKYYTVKQFAEKFGFISESGLRYLIFHADKNGFNKVIKRIGRKVLIDYQSFQEWIEEINSE